MNTKNKLINSFLGNIEGWKSVLDSSPDLITVLDTEFNVIWVNKSMTNVMGNCSGLKCFEAVHGTESPISNCPHAKMMMDCQEHSQEITDENLGGHFLVTTSPINGESGNVIGSIHIARNINEDKRAKENIQRLADVVESSDDAIITKSFDGTIISWNRGAEQIYGYSAEEVIGKQISIIEPPQLILETEKLINKIKNGEKVDHYETLRLKKDGKLINVSVTLSPVFSTSGELAAISTIARNITERKKAEEQKQELLERTQLFAEELEVSNEELQATTEELQAANEELQVTTEELQVSNEELRQQEEELLKINNSLGESEERFRALADNIPNLAWMADSDGWIFWYNKQWYDYTGTTLEEMQGWGWQKVHHPDYVNAVTEEWSTSIKEEKPYDNIFPLRSKEGEYHWFLTRVIPIRDEQGNIQRWFGTNTDITEHKKAEEALLWNQQRNELLAEVSSRLLTSENPQDIIDDLCYKTMKFMECDVFFNYLADEEKGCLHLNAYSGIPKEEAQRIEWLDYGVAVCGCAALESRRIISENIFETPDPRTELVKGYGVQAYACHPLMINGMSIGTLSFGTNSRIKFTNEELELMKAVADQIAIAMNRLISNRILKESGEAAIQVRNEWERTFEAVPDLIAILDADYKIVRANKAMADKFGLKPKECTGLTCYDVVHGTDEPPSFCPHKHLLEDGNEHKDEIHEDNLGGDFLVSASPLYDSEGKIRGSVHVARDINERKRKEKELYQLNKAYKALSNSSHAMIRAKNELEYLEEVCRIIVEDCGHSMVWIGYAEDNEYKTVQPMAHAGFEGGYIETLNVTWSDTEHGHGPTGTAIRTGKPSTCINMHDDPQFEPWRENAIKRGYASSLALPLKMYGKVLGALTIYSIESDAFSEDEVKLLTELAENLSYGINVIRLRIVREQMEKALIRSENEFRTLAENSPDIIARFDKKNRHVYVNPAAAEPYGLSQEDIIGKTHGEIGMDPEKTAFWEKHHNKVFTTGKPETIEFQYKSPQGEEYYFNTQIVPEFVDGEVKSVLAISRDITYIKEAEVELKEARANLEIQVKERTLELEEAYQSLKFANNYNRSLIEANLDPLVTIGPDGKITDVNYSTELVTGYSRDEIIGTDFSDYFTEPEKAREGYKEVFREGWVFDYPLEIKHKDKSVTPVLYNASVYRNEEGEVIGVFAAARDITEMKQAENEIKRQAELLNLTQEAIIVRDMENKILFWNDGAVKIYGWGMEEAKSKITHSLLKTEFPVPLKEVNKELISNGRWGGELVHTKRDGSQITVLSRQVLKKNEKGNPISILEINSDISERKKMEEELEFAGKYNRNLIETSLDPLVTIGPDGKITDVNGATEAVTGHTRDELIGTDFSDYFTQPEKAREGYKQVFKDRWIIDYPLEIKHKKGHITPVLYNASVYEDESGKVIGVFAAARDITERKKAEKMLKLKLEELARSNAELEQFAYVSSHDLQEPLRMIGSYLQLLQRRYHGELDDKADKYIDFAVDGASRMQNLINDLLEFSRVTTRAREFESTDCEFILNQALFNLEISIKESEAVISNDHLPTLMADSTQLTQVFQNLISNAIKFRSEKTPEINISAREKGDEWIFSIADNGIGIDPKHSERIFEVFKRLHKRREYPGTGIGLSICKKIVERHGGHIWVESEIDKGSVFYFTLPNSIKNH
ncbi:PAS domain S-box protein [Methanobacterium sp.]|uniref:PAS domain S-box protein n=1 Tax=Methanobacterium sp. TaxID=2164 RepID=UPI003C77E425